MGTQNTHASCLRCDARLEYVETTQLVQRDGALNVLPAALLANTDPIEVHACPTCGHVELFLERVGAAMRGRATRESVSRIAGRAAGRLLGKRSAVADEDASSESRGR